ncbi:hypothetical protein [Paenibacillus silviterrae]|uniref:LexA family protein n=1 Tax=Paenibacillus silviterrae TaxID=3242194 RepID=UPI0025428ADE|nr:hypothetical protein [Paenibacillus chinjuensis]
MHQYIIEKGYPPTIREIGTLVDLKSPSTVYGHLERLRTEELSRGMNHHRGR